jgi:hypothetical protein
VPKKACGENGRVIADHIVQSYKVIKEGKGATQHFNRESLSFPKLLTITLQ